jgi:hypothetical protein
MVTNAGGAAAAGSGPRGEIGETETGVGSLRGVGSGECCAGLGCGGFDPRRRVWLAIKS